MLKANDEDVADEDDDGMVQAYCPQCERRHEFLDCTSVIVCTWCGWSTFHDAYSPRVEVQESEDV